MTEQYRFKFDINMPKRVIDVSVISETDDTIAAKTLKLDNAVALRDHLNSFITMCNLRNQTCKYLNELNENKDLIHKYVKNVEGSFYTFELDNLAVPEDVLNEILEELAKNENGVEVGLHNNVFTFASPNVEQLVEYVHENIISLFLSIYMVM